jgi:hypothetical protein
MLKSVGGRAVTEITKPIYRLDLVRHTVRVCKSGGSFYLEPNSRGMLKAKVFRKALQGENRKRGKVVVISPVA